MTTLTLAEAEKAYQDAARWANICPGDEYEAAKQALSHAAANLRAATLAAVKQANPEPQDAILGFDNELE